MIPIAKPMLGEEEKRAVLEVLDSGMLAQGKKVAEFERQFAACIGVKHAIATSNGTTALHAALLAHGIGPGDEIITTPFSFTATANAIRMAGAEPVFVDIDEKTFNINPDLIEKVITPKTKAILPVHLFGQSCEMEKISALCKKHQLILIEDAAQAHGAEYQGNSAETQVKKVGSFGTGCFSFYATKNMTTGEGGMITTNDDVLATQLRKLISHGSERKYFHDTLGYNYRMTDIAAAIGIAQLKKLPEYTKKRKENAAYFTAYLKNVPGIVTPQASSDHLKVSAFHVFPTSHVFHQYTLRVTPAFSKTRDELLTYLDSQGIGSAVFYPLPIHKQKAYAAYAHLSFPVAEKAAQEVLSLPVHPALTQEDLSCIIQAVRRAGLKQ